MAFHLSDRIRQFICISTLLLAGHFVYSQEIVWADSLEYEYNSYGIDEWSGHQVVGPPDAIMGDLSEYAFRVIKEAEFGTVVVRFNEPRTAKRIVIIENNVPGRITEVDIIDVDNNRYTAFRGLPFEISDYDNRALVIPLSRDNVEIKMISVNVNTIPQPGWAQIDAIGMTDAPDFATAEAVILEYGDYYIEEVLPFISEREPLGQNINTEYDENKPMISPNGLTLYFTRSYYPENFRGENDEMDIYFSRMRSRAWRMAENIGPPLNNKQPNGVTSVSADGNSLLLINKYDKGSLNSRASLTLRTKEGWSEPVNLYIENYYNLSPYEDYYLAANNEILIMAMERMDTYGGLDLYISFRGDEGVWTEPVNLGPDVNTSMNDFSPFLASDGRTLYFASEGHGGFGRSDIFFIRRLDASWLEWSKPVNIGSAINTSGMDAYYSVPAQGDFAYFVSTNGSIEGSRDIFRIRLPEEFRPEPVELVDGSITNIHSGEPISARIYFESTLNDFDKGSAITDPNSGNYSVVLTAGKNYEFHVQAPNYFPVDDFMDLTDITEYGELRKDIQMVPLEVNEVVKLNNVTFVHETADITDDSFLGLERLVSFINDHPTMRLEIHCYASSGPEGLAQNRCEQIRYYLINRGIKDRNLEFRPMEGDSDHIDFKILEL